MWVTWVHLARLSLLLLNDSSQDNGLNANDLIDNADDDVHDDNDDQDYDHNENQKIPPNRYSKTYT